MDHLSDKNWPFVRRTRKSAPAADEPDQKARRLLLHLGPGLRQAIEGDEAERASAEGRPTGRPLARAAESPFSSEAGPQELYALDREAT